TDMVGKREGRVHRARLMGATIYEAPALCSRGRARIARSLPGAKRIGSAARIVRQAQERHVSVNRIVPVFDIGNVLIRWDPHCLYRKLIPDDAERQDFLTRICSGEWNLEMDRGKPFAQGVAERIALFPDKADLIRAFHE